MSRALGGWRGALLGSVLALAGCGTVLGFEDFEVAPGGAGSQEGCKAGDLRCDGRLLQVCRAGGTGFDLLETCASQPLCEAGREQTGKCATPACGPGSRDPLTGGELPRQRCVGGRIEICTGDATQYVATDCAGKQCDPGGGRCLAIAIDAHEVTFEEYGEFQGMAGKPAPPDVCKDNDLQPDEKCVAERPTCPQPGCEKLPRNCVDWCDAYQYCQAMGQHLCGLVGNDTKMAPRAGFADPGQSEWMNACSAGGENDWVLGDEWADSTQGQICNGSSAKRSAALGNFFFPAADQPKCASPVPGYGGIVGLAGNVAEWENACDRAPNDPAASLDDNCQVRGGSALGAKEALRCDAERIHRRRDPQPDVGFRCCGPK